MYPISDTGNAAKGEESIDIINSRIDNIHERERRRNRKASLRGNNNKNIYTPVRNSAEECFRKHSR